MNVRGIVDRTEENYAVVELESGEFTQIPLDDIEVVEGDVVEICENKIISLDKNATETRKKEAERLLKKLFDKK